MEEYTILQRYSLRAVYKFNGGDLTLSTEISEKERRALEAISQYGSKRSMPASLRFELFSPEFEIAKKIRELLEKYSKVNEVRAKAEVILEIIDEEYKFFNRTRKIKKRNIDFDKFCKLYKSLLYPATGNFGSEIYNQVVELYSEKYEGI